MYKIALMRGDGIGPEVVDSALEVLHSVGFEFEPVDLEVGYDAYKKTGNSLPDGTVETVRDCNAVLFGAVTTPPKIKGYQSAIVLLRRELDLYANVRPARSYKGISQHNVNLTIIRENTEGLYIGEEQRTKDQATSVRRITEKGSRRIAEFAYDYAAKNNFNKVTVVHKANILRETCGLFRDIALEVAEEHPEIETNELLVDAAAMKLILYPEEFQVILTTNIFGDILSDEVAGLVGGLGLVPSGNIGTERGLFEPVHGSAPDIAGKGIANPCATILAAKMMLEYLGEVEIASQVENAVGSTLKETRTIDLRGSTTTAEFTKNVIKNLEVEK